MDVTACSVCVLAASAGGAVGGYLAAGRQGRRRGRRSLRGSATMRAWPGGRRADPVPRAAVDHIDDVGHRGSSGGMTAARAERMRSGRTSVEVACGPAHLPE